MANRVLFFLIAAFWLTMNVLLWRSEFRDSNQPGSRVPVAMVWEKVLTAPDDSLLEIRQRGKQIGNCRWAANVGEEIATGKVGREDQPSGQVKKLGSYTIDIDRGNVFFGSPTNRIKFDVGLVFSTNHTWQEFRVQGSRRRSSLQLRADASAETFALQLKDEDDRWERTFTFAELQQPDKLLAEIGGPLVVGLLGSIGGLKSLGDLKKLSLGLNWEARQDSLKFGHSRIRVYRLSARLLDRYSLVILVSRTGEIIRAELPNEITLVNLQSKM
jgi:hypothetical protein